ncbi:hypothetical protein AB9128_09155 [Streptomyces cinereoruber]|uniref:hypothetical protein n=1 Tax=Streptomyces cinereoruber TaxID=67260 RepID=UPI003EB87080
MNGAAKAAAVEAVPVDEHGTPDEQAVPRSTTALHGDDGDISRARRPAAGFLIRAQDEDGLPVSRPAVDLTRPVVTEPVTDARERPRHERPCPAAGFHPGEPDRHLAHQALECRSPPSRICAAAHDHRLISVCRHDPP